MSGRWERLADYLLLLVTFGPVMLALLIAHQVASYRFCPEHTFLAGTLTTYGRLISVGILAYALGYLMLRGLLLLVPPLVRIAGYPPKYAHKPIPGSRSAGRIKTAIFFCVVMTPWAVGTAAAEFCLMPAGIGYRAEPWQPMRTYAWSRLQAVETSCEGGRNRVGNASYDLILDDGTVINILTANPDAARAYGPMSKALAGRTIPFTAQVSQHCHAPQPDFLRRPL